MSFHEYSKSIVEDYLGTVAYVDDLIFSSRDLKKNKPIDLGTFDMKVTSASQATVGNQQIVEEILEIQTTPNINPLIFSNAFIDKGIHCTLLEVTDDDQSLDPIKNVLKKSDVIILDWQMHQDLGEKATELITSTLSEPKKCELRLIVIYTNDPNYLGILPGVILPRLQEIGFENIVLADNNCTLVSGYTKIVVLVKDNLHLTEIGVTDLDLPNRVIEEFTLLTKGLVSNAIIKSITAIKSNVHLLLGKYSKSVDPAYLGHAALIEHKEDSSNLLTKIISNSIEEILCRAEVKNVFNDPHIKEWIDENIQEKEFDLEVFDEERDKIISLGKVKRDKILVDKLYRNYKTGFDDSQNYKGLNKTDKTSVKEYFEKQSTKYFCNEFNENIDIQFAVLTHHKNMLPLNDEPFLTLGTVVRFGDKEEYWICIQQKCDSLRINGDRRFLFLPFKIIKGNAKFDFITPDGIKLRLLTDTFGLKTIFFKANTGTKRVTAKKSTNDKFYFESKYSSEESPEHYFWVFELKDSHAQRIANNFAAQLSRVGLDESEWLRRS